MKFLICVMMVVCSSYALMAQDIRNNPKGNHANKFEELGTILPTGNEYRTASGAPGSKYWQQRADYKISCELDETNHTLHGKETITYYNNSPDALVYLWLQLDENEHDPTVASVMYDESKMKKALNKADLLNIDTREALQGLGDKIEYVTNALKQPLKYTINQTMMRVELPKPLAPGALFVFNIGWHYKIPDRILLSGGRGGLELFPQDGNCIFTISQWFPRLCVYSDFQGWQNHQFTGRGEFALVFGNYDVDITVPADHLVAATGECQNYAQVLSPVMLKRWQQAQTATDVVEIGILADAKAAETKKAVAKKKWNFKATMVRDFAWTSSRKFIWDAMPVFVEGKKIMCMSFYPKEAYNLWRKFSTKSVAHTIKVYSHFTTSYPYPVAQSVEASSGMEYPMICFNHGRCAPDGSYTEAIKYSMLGVIIHEVGHNFFPMIINSDERQWSWMDEGLNSFVQYLAQELWDNKFPSTRGPVYKIVDYMKLPKDQLEPIMTNSENINSFGSNAYAKPAAGLNMLRETIMGRELFDYALKEYSRRWAFKHPTPADFFRTMEDASAVNLDWFWRGWFYGTDACDISLDTVKVWQLVANREDKIKPDTQKIDKPMGYDSFEEITKLRNREDKKIIFATDADTSLRDFYWYYVRGLKKVDTTNVIQQKTIEREDASMLNKFEKKWFYEVSCSNKGGLVMPLIIQWKYKDGTVEVERIAAEIWRKNEKKITKVFIKDKEVASIKLDPYRETADIDEKNNNWPETGNAPTRFQLYKSNATARGTTPDAPNPMVREMK